MTVSEEERRGGESSFMQEIMFSSVVPESLDSPDRAPSKRETSDGSACTLAHTNRTERI